MPILLIGPRACGKSSVATELAVRLGVRSIDLDTLVLGMFGADSVGAVWDRHGEAAWRRVEASALWAALRSEGSVVALGGGTPVIAGAADAIRAHRDAGAAWVVYLRCGPACLSQRLTEAPGDRPPLTDLAAREESAAVLEEREPTYVDVASLVVDAEGRIEHVVDRVEAAALRG